MGGRRGCAQVVFEVLSPGNRPKEMGRKFRFYEKYGVEEYYIYDPDTGVLQGWMRKDDGLEEVSEMLGHTSPRLGIRFQPGEGPDNLVILGPDGEPFATHQELAERAEMERQRAETERQRRRGAAAPEAERQSAEAERQRATGSPPSFVSWASSRNDEEAASPPPSGHPPRRCLASRYRTCESTRFLASSHSLTSWSTTAPIALPSISLARMIPLASMTKIEGISLTFHRWRLGPSSRPSHQHRQVTSPSLMDD